MRAAEAYWAGRIAVFDANLSEHRPKCFFHPLRDELSKAIVPTGKYFADNDAVRINAPGLQAAVKQISPFNSAWRVAMEMDVVATEAAKRAEAALASLDTAGKAFLSHVRNDLTSMKAASDRVQSEVTQMQQRYRAAQDLLTSPEFERAIANAERMATALQAIAGLSETRLSVAVFGADKRG